ncbi:universal stress protein [Gynuella sunshinyii]|uniref:Universal stress protein UspA and related nucleotide-binding protein n=1 Tax=Gynuella sunshinyii YC6258 TaxID=1445510 RepID=A0A0C5VE29_9GAMM|nr:universal stress protein [Gynuella sunshinyii]AJQ92747.1 universal stress protein UspA and related nucleotide-binding protein [Gynuella sunshinyii YC6258]
MNTPKVLLMPLSSSGEVSERLQGALAVAKYFGAQLQVLHASVHPSRFVPHEVAGLSRQFMQELERIAGTQSRQDADQLRGLFKQLADQGGVPVRETPLPDGASACWHEVEGLRSELVARRGRVADLLIIPQGRDGAISATLEAAILQSGSPVLVMPRTQTVFCPHRIAIAWNGTPEVSRAVRSALPFLHRCSDVRILTHETTSDRVPGPEALQVYLRSHSIDAKPQWVKHRHRNDGADLLKAAQNEHCDLIVMGAYSHHRLQQQAFGGVTRRLLQHSPIPLLMSH